MDHVGTSRRLIAVTGSAASPAARPQRRQWSGSRRFDSGQANCPSTCVRSAGRPRANRGRAIGSSESPVRPVSPPSNGDSDSPVSWSYVTVIRNFLLSLLPNLATETLWARMEVTKMVSPSAKGIPAATSRPRGSARDYFLNVRLADVSAVDTLAPVTGVLVEERTDLLGNIDFGRHDNMILRVASTCGKHPAIATRGALHAC